MRLPQVGAAGQARLAAARVAIVGVGATGSHLAETLGRAGVGYLRLIDRDVVELSNLPRQVLFTHADAEQLRPKAPAAADALRAIDPGLQLDPRVLDLSADNALSVLAGVDLVLDGTDNFSTRFLINDVCVRERIPFLYCGVVGVEGQMLLVRSGSACLRCYVPEPPQPGELPTCDTAGVLGSAVALVTALGATLALQVLLGDPAARSGEVLVVEAWQGELRRLTLPREPNCPCCVRAEYPFLLAAPAAQATELCGREAVQLPADSGVGGPTSTALDLLAIAAGLRDADGVQVLLSAHMLRLELAARHGRPARRVLLFRDGRTIVGGTRDAGEARSIRARLLGA
ncbi:MAG: ThiF family adenylyltransferase [Planctomycetota bacterium]